MFYKGTDLSKELNYQILVNDYNAKETDENRVVIQQIAKSEECLFCCSKRCRQEPVVQNYYFIFPLQYLLLLKKVGIN